MWITIISSFLTIWDFYVIALRTCSIELETLPGIRRTLVFRDPSDHLEDSQRRLFRPLSLLFGFCVNKYRNNKQSRAKPAPRG